MTAWRVVNSVENNPKGEKIQMVAPDSKDSSTLFARLITDQAIHGPINEIKQGVIHTLAMASSAF